jgi:phosphate ABC transporter phosphate-binding protein
MAASSRRQHRQHRRHRRLVALAAFVTAVASLTGPAHPATAAVPAPISGAGSTWSYNAINAWIGNVAQSGIRVDYARVGSTSGRSMFKLGTVDWAASDIPYGVKDGVSDDPPPSRGFAYIPDTAGGTAFVYNLTIDGVRVTNLRLSGANIAKIFTGALTRWNDPALAADNPGLGLPDIPIVPVVRSDGSGSTAQFTQWMVATEGQYWTAYCAAVGRNPCTQTSAYPVLSGSGMVGESGDIGVSGYVAQAAANGAIGYTEYSSAIAFGFPVAKVLNAAGYYTEPSAGHVAVSLLKAKVDTDPSNLSTYLTEDLTDVYTDPDPRTYELSSYSYMILPTTTEFGFTTDKGFTLGEFGKYALCQGQSVVDALGYSALPINLVLAGFDQLRNVPGAQVPTTTTDIIQSCNNPTFAPDGTNTLANTDPQPQACDRQGPTQCASVPGETVNVSIPNAEGEFIITVSPTVRLGDAVLSADLTTFEATGQLGTVTIIDGRNQTRPGWSVSGQVSDFTGAGGTVAGTGLGWTPAVITQNPAHDVVAGPLLLPGTAPGLTAGAALANAGAGKGLGTSVLGADLDLRMPSSTPPGQYSATLTVTVIPAG